MLRTERNVSESSRLADLRQSDPATSALQVSWRRRSDAESNTRSTREFLPEYKLARLVNLFQCDWVLCTIHNSEQFWVAISHSVTMLRYYCKVLATNFLTDFWLTFSFTFSFSCPALNKLHLCDFIQEFYLPQGRTFHRQVI